MDDTSTNRNSMKLDFEAVRLSDSIRENPKETYKPISDTESEKFVVVVNNNNNNNSSTNSISNNNNNNSKKMGRDKDVENNIEDGADEKMLGTGETDKLAQKDEVKFISGVGGDHKNGDAKIDIIAMEKAFTGMTKDELMKFANDPFWVRLRWLFFILFWSLWIAMLIGAVLIIIHAPKCAAPVPLTWYKQGPLVDSTQNSYDYAAIVDDVKKSGAKGVIFEMPSEETYMIDTFEEKYKKLIDTYKAIGVNVILDITPNFVHKNDTLFQQAQVNATLRSAFVWSNRNTNWRSLENGNAWIELAPQQYVLSQFGSDRYDLQFSNGIVQERFIKTLRTLCKLGVRGFRIINAKHLIISTAFKNEESANNIGTTHDQYNYWTHRETTFQPGLGDLLETFANVIRNETNDEGFLSVRDNLELPETFYTTIKTTTQKELPIQLPVYTILTHKLAKNKTDTLAKDLHTEIDSIKSILGNNVWLQWQYDLRTLAGSPLGISEYNMFIMLLPGVPVSTLNGYISANVTDTVLALDKMRNTPSYMHGTFTFFDYPNNIAAYTRIKSGNPGYLVVLNPNSVEIEANFSDQPSFPEQMTVHLVSYNYKVPDVVEKTKLSTAAIKLSPHSVIILTYVPKSVE